MKKLTFLSAAALVALSLVSCKKDHTCTCTSSSTAPGSKSTTTEYTILDAKKADAKRACVKTSTDYAMGGNTYTNTRDCKLN